MSTPQSRREPDRRGGRVPIHMDDVIARLECTADLMTRASEPTRSVPMGLLQLSRPSQPQVIALANHRKEERIEQVDSNSSTLAVAIVRRRMHCDYVASRATRAGWHPSLIIVVPTPALWYPNSVPIAPAACGFGISRHQESDYECCCEGRRAWEYAH